MQQNNININYTEYSNENELSFQDKKLVVKAKEAALSAYAPYSEFKVGASLLLENDEIIIANNQENAAYPSGLCAERVALFYANANYPKTPVVTIAICAITKNGLTNLPVPPCGSCRQVMVESEVRFNKPIRLIMIGASKILVVENTLQMLPFNFEKDFLQK